MLDFDMPEGDEILLSSIYRMMERHFHPTMIRDYDRQHKQPLHMVSIMAKLGLFALPMPVRYVEWPRTGELSLRCKSALLTGAASAHCSAPQ